ncbi:hypothetical protein [Magnetococcus marinus]|uniref:hypothetical protein n=1 Tax=Magnetococcus marinus TaxID=1124597 RepID=UPI00135F175D|nr:hypothetical protein [Magnetococcus marinus]
MGEIIGFLIGAMVVAWFLNAILIQPIATFIFGVQTSTYPFAFIFFLIASFLGSCAQ